MPNIGDGKAIERVNPIAVINWQPPTVTLIATDIIRVKLMVRDRQIIISMNTMIGLASHY